MAKGMLTTMGSATAVAAVVGGCLLLGPTPQAQAGTNPICGTNNGTTSCVTFSKGSFTATQTNKSGASSGSFSWNPFCVMATNTSGTNASFPDNC